MCHMRVSIDGCNMERYRVPLFTVPRGSFMEWVERDIFFITLKTLQIIRHQLY